MSSRTARSRTLRQELVAFLEEKKGIQSSLVRRAFLNVPRELFVPEFAEDQGLEAVYKDRAIPTKKDALGIPISSSSQPVIMAMMLEHLDLRPGLRVLEIGTGTGYNAALMSAIVGRRGRVTSIDIEDDLVATARKTLRGAGFRADVVVGDGRKGWPRKAPYDRIIATASSSNVPKPWFRQLAKDGRLVLPFRFNDEVAVPQAVAIFRRRATGLESTEIISGGFMGLRAKSGDPANVQALTVHELQDGTDLEIAHLAGSNLERLSRDTKRQLLGLFLSKRFRRHALKLRAPWWRSLDIFVAIAAPRGEALTLGNGAIALLNRNPLGLAVLSGEKRGIDRILGYGDPAAERALLDLTKEWKRIGKPLLNDLKITIHYGNVRPRAWRTVRRDAGVIAFDWKG